MRGLVFEKSFSKAKNGQREKYDRVHFNLTNTNKAAEALHENPWTVCQNHSSEI